MTSRQIENKYILSWIFLGGYGESMETRKWTYDMNSGNLFLDQVRDCNWVINHKLEIFLLHK